MAPKTSTKPQTVVSAPAPVVAETSSTSKGKKVVKSSPVVEPAPVVTAPVDTPNASTEAHVEQSLEDQFKALTTALDGFQQQVRSVRQAVNALYKKAQSDVKVAGKGSRHRRRQQPNADGELPKKAPSGIVKPTLVSEEMCKFMGKPAGSMVARTEVTKFITEYIKNNNLQNPAQKRNILPNDALRSLLKVPTNEDLTYFNLQKYMKVHFPKAETVEVAH
jgi:chromatin remodeling complex protein RSC6